MSKKNKHRYEQGFIKEEMQMDKKIYKKSFIKDTNLLIASDMLVKTMQTLFLYNKLTKFKKIYDIQWNREMVGL